MRIAEEMTVTTPVRIGLSLTAAVVALAGAAVLVRPEMTSMGMAMVRGLVVGFGL